MGTTSFYGKHVIGSIIWGIKRGPLKKNFVGPQIGQILYILNPEHFKGEQT